MIICKLPWKERKVISTVAKLYYSIALRSDDYMDRYRQFWRISMYIKGGFFLWRADLEAIITSMEAVLDAYQKNPALQSEEVNIQNLSEIIPKLKALL